MKLKLLIAVILTTTAPIMSSAQNDYPPTKLDFLRLFYQYMEWQSYYQYPTTKQESVTGNYLRVKEDDYPSVKNGIDSSVPHFGRPDFQTKDMAERMSNMDKEIYELLFHD